MAKALSEMTGDGRVFFDVPDFSAAADRGFVCVDMHFHTNQSDSFTKVRDALMLARARGTGIAVTDHNLIGSAVRAAESKDVLVIPGMEVSTTDGPHILVYFYDVPDLKAYWGRWIKPNLQSCPWLALKDMPVTKLLDTLEDENCVVSAAHPMGYFGNCKGIEACIRKGYLSEDTAKRLDAYEVICSGMTRSANLRALEAASGYGIGFTGGTDAHLLEELGNVVTMVKAADRYGFLDGVAGKRNLVTGLEKSAYMKVKTGSASFMRFLGHAPSALHTQGTAVGRSVTRYSRKLGVQTSDSVKRIQKMTRSKAEETAKRFRVKTQGPRKPK